MGLPVGNLHEWQFLCNLPSSQVTRLWSPSDQTTDTHCQISVLLASMILSLSSSISNNWTTYQINEATGEDMELSGLYPCPVNCTLGVPENNRSEAPWEWPRCRARRCLWGSQSLVGCRIETSFFKRSKRLRGRDERTAGSRTCVASGVAFPPRAVFVLLVVSFLIWFLVKWARSCFGLISPFGKCVLLL